MALPPGVRNGKHVDAHEFPGKKQTFLISCAPGKISKKHVRAKRKAGLSKKRKRRNPREGKKIKEIL